VRALAHSQAMHDLVLFVQKVQDRHPALFVVQVRQQRNQQRAHRLCTRQPCSIRDAEQLNRQGCGLVITCTVRA
jgi:hypothetical protein